MAKNEDVLYGVEAIRQQVGNATESTIMRWKIEYPSFPIRKLGGIWVAHRETLVEWFRDFCKGEIKAAVKDRICNNDGCNKSK